MAFRIIGNGKPQELISGAKKKNANKNGKDEWVDYKVDLSEVKDPVDELKDEEEE